MFERYAIYYAPPSGSMLADFGRRWLGRDAETEEPATPPSWDGLNSETHWRITDSPRHYGFHGTLKPPFRLAGGCSENGLIEAMKAFADGRASFNVPELQLECLGDFLALTPACLCPDLHKLAADCMGAFDRFRAASGIGELAKRCAAGLTPRQEHLLSQWGYPYVLEEYRFHLTLTGRIEDPHERQQVHDILLPLVRPVCRSMAIVADVCLFAQETTRRPFRLLLRAPFHR